MFTVGARRTRHPLVSDSSATARPTSSTIAGSQVAPNAAPQGMQAEVRVPSPASTGPRAPLGPSVRPTAGIPRRSTGFVVQVSRPEVRPHFSSSVIAVSSASTRSAPVAVTDRALTIDPSQASDGFGRRSNVSRSTSMRPNVLE